MPHTHAIFEDCPYMRTFIKSNKTTIRQVVADVTGYKLSEVAFFSTPIREEDMELTDNLLPLELVIDAGEGWHKYGDSSAVRTMVNLILERCPGADAMHFSVWPRALKSYFSEYKPNTP